MEEIAVCMNGQNREDVAEGLEVDIIQKEDQRTGPRHRGGDFDQFRDAPARHYGTIRANSTMET